MGKIVDVYGKKIFSLALIFNSLLTIVYAIGLLAGYYTLQPKWTPYPPYIINGQLFWILIPAAIINIFPCVNIGKVHTGRLWFHHYVYGFFVAGLSATLTSLWAPASDSTLFTIYTTNPAVNVGRFFVLGGTTLVIDDLADVSKRLKSVLNSLKSKAMQNGRMLNLTQLIMGFAELYFLLAISVYLSQHPIEITIANVILLGTLLVTIITSFANVRRRAWLDIEVETTDQPELPS